MEALNEACLLGEENGEALVACSYVDPNVDEKLKKIKEKYFI